MFKVLLSFSVCSEVWNKIGLKEQLILNGCCTQVYIHLNCDDLYFYCDLFSKILNIIFPLGSTGKETYTARLKTKN
jgi:hypothetical protein